MELIYRFLCFSESLNFDLAVGISCLLRSFGLTLSKLSHDLARLLGLAVTSAAVASAYLLSDQICLGPEAMQKACSVSCNAS